MTLHFREYMTYFSYYENHRLLIGPSTSLDPEGGLWTELANAGTMLNFAANESWAHGYVADISAYYSDSVRIAFHYEGMDADEWYIDDVCIALTDETTYPASCIFEEDFDGTVSPFLPPGWTSVSGATSDDPTADWTTSNLHHYSSPLAAYSGYLQIENLSIYLVSPAITLE